MCPSLGVHAKHQAIVQSETHHYASEAYRRFASRLLEHLVLVRSALRRHTTRTRGNQDQILHSDRCRGRHDGRSRELIVRTRWRNRPAHGQRFGRSTVDIGPVDLTVEEAVTRYVDVICPGSFVILVHNDAFSASEEEFLAGEPPTPPRCKPQPYQACERGPRR